MRMAIDNVNHMVPGFSVVTPPELQKWLSINGFKPEAIRRNKWIHYITQKELQLFSWYSADLDDYALEFVDEHAYINNIINVRLWAKLLSTSAPIILPKPLDITSNVTYI